MSVVENLLFLFVFWHNFSTVGNQKKSNSFQEENSISLTELLIDDSGQKESSGLSDMLLGNSDLEDEDRQIQVASIVFSAYRFHCYVKDLK